MKPPACIITGGETTVTLRARAWAGATRNSCWRPPSTSPALDNVVVFSAGTDGTDGPTDAAGAIADGATLAPQTRTRAVTWQRNDSYHYFEALGDLVKTGPTNTNVMDVRLVLVGSEK